jgi:hypothetical protein
MGGAVHIRVFVCRGSGFLRVNKGYMLLVQVH